MTHALVTMCDWLAGLLVCLAPFLTSFTLYFSLSMGVICYVLLAGYPPFYDEDQKRLFKKIKEGRYHFHEDYWSNTSPEVCSVL